MDVVKGFLKFAYYSALREVCRLIDHEFFTLQLVVNIVAELQK